LTAPAANRGEREGGGKNIPIVFTPSDALQKGEKRGGEGGGGGGGVISDHYTTHEGGGKGKKKKKRQHTTLPYGKGGGKEAKGLEGGGGKELKKSPNLFHRDEMWRKREKGEKKKGNRDSLSS